MPFSLLLFCTIFFQFLFSILDLVRSFAGEEFIGEEEEEVTEEELAYIAREEEEVAGEEFTGEEGGETVRGRGGGEG